MKQCIISFDDIEIIEKLSSLGYECNRVIQSNRVSGPISAHSDILYTKLNNNEIILSGCQRGNIALLEKAGYKVTTCDDFKPGYKTESFLNFIINNNTIIYNPETALYINGDYNRIKVRQGYTKCSTIPVNNNAYITDDDNIYNALSLHGADCLKIKKGDIQLNGYNYGFIGGASVKLNEREILFFGDISDITDKKNVINFLARYNINAIFIENKKLNDIGSALIL